MAECGGLRTSSFFGSLEGTEGEKQDRSQLEQTRRRNFDLFIGQGGLESGGCGETEVPVRG